MRHFDAWLLRDPYSIWHYYSTGRRWQETVRDLIQERKICAPPVDLPPSTPSRPVDPYARPVNPQCTSPLFGKLPAEIRMIIYRYVFGDEAVHLVQLKGKIRHVRCQHTSSSLDSHRHCCPITPARWRAGGAATPGGHSDSMLYPHTHPALPSTLSNGSLALLRTCRAVYAEAADLPYATPVFDVDDLHTFIAFSLTIDPHRLRAIRRLTVQWMPIWQPMAGQEHIASIYAHTHNDRLWALFWSRVAACRGLEELHLSIDLGRFTKAGTTTAGSLLGGQRLRLDVREPWVAPLLSVRGLRAFELGITARCDADADADARSLLEENLRRDAVTLRDHLRAVMCSAPGEAILVPGVELWKPCPVGEWDELAQPDRRRRSRPRLAITAQ
ncbi:uncharacterized protein CDV56_109295 [Aspergillus thermomutatus]|uniref:DUF7730 domain-containing protein n=1 Tax=Aspergillus thermomutatus TaxID=41047 RepID=A0A397HYG2_ASPTH|nr:uncharacterized protein CDV56_109295 [Aspergillus thermomutatus]RHZ66244.1 hypothetical protein CDV56_109295 [Aspergillus thermomutatus]